MARTTKSKQKKPQKKSVLEIDMKAQKPVEMQVADYVDMNNGGFMKLGYICKMMTNKKASLDPRIAQPALMKKTKFKKEIYLDIECGFDIETTKVPQYDDKGNVIGYKSYMYIWQMVLGEYIITGRTWEQWHMAMNFIQNALCLYTIQEDVVVTDKNGNPVFKPDGTVMTFKKTDRRNIIMWIANSGFEFQFLSSHLQNYFPIAEPANVFADKPRKPIKYTLNFTGISSDQPNLTGLYRAQGAGFVVLDAVRVVGGGLKTIAKNYCVTQKAVGDLDYDIPRNSQTYLDPTEMGYVYNDVKILYEWARFYMDVYMKQCKFMPMTATGIIREAVKFNFRKLDSDKANKGAYSSWMISLQPVTIQEYFRVVFQLYRGGYTHGNITLINKLIEGCKGMDYTSSYPATMLQCLFPMTPFQNDIDIRTEDELVEFCEAYCSGWLDKDMTMDEKDQANFRCWYADFTFYGVRQKTGHSIENIAKVGEYINNGRNKKKYMQDYNAIIDNGKILYTDQMSVTLTEQDFRIYQQFYEWDAVEISGFQWAHAGHLPDYLTDVTKEMYKRKSVLKRQKLDKTIEYVIAKAFVNGLYGLCVQKMHFDEVMFEVDENGIAWADAHKMFDDTGQQIGMKSGKLKEEELSDAWNYEYREKLGTDMQADIVLSPYWGVWITAHARARILDAICTLGIDAIYSDTDSVYYRNPDKHADYFKKWNAYIETMNRHLFGKDYDDLGDLGEFDPIEIDGHDTFAFKTLGAKRYIKYDCDDNVEVTIAGLPKGSLQKAAIGTLCEEKHCKPEDLTKAEIRERLVELFRSDVNIVTKYSQKRTHSYCDTEHSDTVTDLQGHTEVMTEGSSISIYDIDFTMTVEADWLRMAETIQKEGFRVGESRFYKK